MVRPDYSGQDKQIRILNQAMHDDRVLKIRYRSASQGKVIEARFHPYGLLFFGMNLYCVGYLEAYDEVRTLKVARFLGVETTDQEFSRPATFSLKGYSRGSFGVFGPGKFETIKARFTGWAATNVREHVWHPSQQVLKDDGTTVTASWELSDTTEFRRWLLGFGPHARVLSPAKLARQIAEDLQRACGLYGPVETQS
jgi:predicted DNA-binding transcriptional regulator YafY